MRDPLRPRPSLDHEKTSASAKPSRAPDGIAGPGNPGGCAAAERAHRDPGGGDVGCDGGSVWLVGQRSPATQRRGRYVPSSVAHRARMWPEIARQAILRYSRPGDLVLDPLCGTGTTPVEAVHAGRDAIGIDYAHRWADLAQANLDLARGQGATGTGLAVLGDATALASVLPAAIRGQVDLVVTSPPHGRTMPGTLEHPRGPLIRHHAICSNSHADLSDDFSGGTAGGPEPVNLAHRGRVDLIEGLTHVLTGCAELLRPGGIAVITARPCRRDGLLIDLPGAFMAAGQAVGLEPVQRCVVLLAVVRGDRLLPRHSFFQLAATRKWHRQGIPLQSATHQDVVVLRRPPNWVSSSGLSCSRGSTSAVSSAPAAGTPWNEVPAGDRDRP